MNLKYSAVATLIIAPYQIAEYAVKMFRKTEEVDSLISIKFNNILEPHTLIPNWKIKRAQKIYKESVVSVGYLLKHVLKRRSDICAALQSIPSSHRMICQVEVPTAKNSRYKNIDIGFTSNGKIESTDRSLIECSIRETLEEARILLNPKHYCQIAQMKKRAELGINLPLHFTNGTVICYIICI